MRQFQKGQVRAFEILLERHQAPVYRFVFRFVADREVARDLVQEVFLRVVARRDSFERRSKFTTWLYTIARNLCIDHHRRMQHRRHQSLDSPAREEGMSLLERLDSGKTPPDESAHQRRLRGHIGRAIEALGHDQKEVFLLREQGVPFDEIARLVGAPLNTVKSRMRYALQNLRANLEAQGVEL
ncbi:MAG: RNA polymerase subunit sigma [Deltaproteobacteria bacterium]|nr:MAG: RNA polymerase subunit sigma [Deltaproteobacteria bacterium]